MRTCAFLKGGRHVHPPQKNFRHRRVAICDFVRFYRGLIVVYTNLGWKVRQEVGIQGVRQGTIFTKGALVALCALFQAIQSVCDTAISGTHRHQRVTY